MGRVITDRVAASPVPLSPAIRTDDFVFLSGQVPRTPEGEIVTGDIKEQTSLMFETISAILDKAGLSLEDVVKTGSSSQTEMISPTSTRSTGSTGPSRSRHEVPSSSISPGRRLTLRSKVSRRTDLEVRSSDSLHWLAVREWREVKRKAKGLLSTRPLNVVSNDSMATGIVSRPSQAHEGVNNPNDDK